VAITTAVASRFNHNRPEGLPDNEIILLEMGRLSGNSAVPTEIVPLSKIATIARQTIQTADQIAPLVPLLYALFTRKSEG
jgi:hypothetical protein